MKKYKFLAKPLFFIFSLLFASWMVLTIEKIKPSDLGKYESLFKTKKNPSLIPKKTELPYKGGDSLLNETKKNYIRRLCMDYKSGAIDSLAFNEQLEQILNVP